MWRVAFAAMAGLLWGLFVTPLTMRLALRYRVVDHPGGRKRHQETMPRGGGLALWSGCVLWALFAQVGDRSVPFLLTAATLIFFAGYVDDMKPLSPLFRLGIQLLAAGIAVAPLTLPWEVRFLFILWIAGCTSSFNNIDGLNGLCLSLAGCCFAVPLALGGRGMWAALCGLCAGVLTWNFPRARTFLGDGGSNLLGFLWGALWVQYRGELMAQQSLISLMVYLFLLGGVPILDTAYAIIRRLLAGRSPFAPDRGHLHYRLLDGGMPLVGVVVVLCLLHVGLLAGGIYGLMGSLRLGLFFAPGGGSFWGL